MFDTSLGLCIKFYTNWGHRGNPCSVSGGKGRSAGAAQNLLQAQPAAPQPRWEEAPCCRHAVLLRSVMNQMF